jgi:hypothetical protein
MKYLLSCVFAFGLTCMQAQNLPLKIVASAGNEVSGNGYKISYTLGEVAVRNTSAGNYYLREGFWQPGVNCTTDVFDLQKNNIEITLFPNPTADQFWVNIEGDLPVELRCTLYNLLGHSIVSNNIPIGTSRFEMNCATLPTGMYFLRFQNLTGQTVKTLAVQKQ